MAWLRLHSQWAAEPGSRPALSVGHWLCHFSVLLVCSLNQSWIFSTVLVSLFSTETFFFHFDLCHIREKLSFKSIDSWYNFIPICFYLLKSSTRSKIQRRKRETWRTGQRGWEEPLGNVAGLPAAPRSHRRDGCVAPSQPAVQSASFMRTQLLSRYISFTFGNLRSDSRKLEITV